MEATEQLASNSMQADAVYALGHEWFAFCSISSHFCVVVYVVCSVMHPLSTFRVSFAWAQQNRAQRLHCCLYFVCFEQGELSHLFSLFTAISFGLQLSKVRTVCQSEFVQYLTQDSLEC